MLPLPAIQAALRAEEVDGWLFYDFRQSDPLAYRILGLSDTGATTRRWYYFVPRAGAPRGLVSAVEPHVLDGLPGDVAVYRTADEHRSAVAALLRGVRRVAMQYSPENAVPYISRVDAGTVELIRGCGVSVVTSADLVQQFEAVWTPAQLASHERAAAALGHTVEVVFAHIAQAVAARSPLTELDVQQLMLDEFRRAGVVTSKPPIVAVDAHSADPHYAPSAATALPIGPGSFVLLDLWAKESDGVYADITWTGQVAETVAPEIEAVFQIVRAGRDAALSAIQESARARRPLPGYAADAAARATITEAGYGEYFVHRTGHSIGVEVHGNGANLDGYETRDTRRLLPHTCFSIEPGIYLPGRFGVRSEIDVYLTESDARVTGPPMQSAVVPILQHFR